MKNTVKSWLKGSCLGVAAILGAAACTDDHFDIQAGVSGSGTQTLWENISSNEELDSLAMILSRTRVLKNDYDNTTQQTYADLLNNPQSFTVWAPKNGTYNAKSYLDRLDQAQELRASGDILAGVAMEYDVANQFVLNHLARFNYEAERGEQEIHMMNGKIAVYNAGAGLFNNVPLAAEFGNINGSNGTMHVLDGLSPFAYNVYDYVATHDTFSKLYGFLTDSLFESREFSEIASTPGAMNPDGEMVYVDSVYYTYNTLLSSSSASVSNEDSTTIAILPTDALWDDVVTKLKSYYNYGSTYNYEWNTSKGDFEKKGASALKLNADSLCDVNAKSEFVKSLFFSPSRFSVNNPKDSAEIINYAVFADSLISTNRRIYYNPNRGEEPNTAGANPLFAGQPIKASNGYIFALDELPIAPEYFWVERVEPSALMPVYVTGATNNGTIVSLTDENRNTEVEGDVDYYSRFTVSGRSNMMVNFALQGVLSATYRLVAVMAPTRIDKAFEDLEEKCVFYVDVLDDEGKVIAKSEDIEISQDKVDRYVLIDKLTFPKCYSDLPTGYTSFPRLRFNLPYNYQIPQMQKGNCKNLNIVALVLEPVEA